MRTVFVLTGILFLSGWVDTRNLTPKYRFVNLAPTIRGRSSENLNKNWQACGNEARCLFSSVWGGNDGYGYEDDYGYGTTYYEPNYINLEYCQQYYDPYTGELWEDCVPYS